MIQLSFVPDGHRNPNYFYNVLENKEARLEKFGVLLTFLTGEQIWVRAQYGNHPLGV
jgi:hypothetical protein